MRGESAMCTRNRKAREPTCSRHCSARVIGAHVCYKNNTRVYENTASVRNNMGVNCSHGDTSYDSVIAQSIVVTRQQRLAQTAGICAAESL